MNNKFTIYFGTTSNVKFAQFRYIFSKKNIDVEPVSLCTEITEPQADIGTDSGVNFFEFIVKYPLLANALHINNRNKVSPCIPFMLEDTMMFVDEFSKNSSKGIGLPGADTKNWWKMFRSKKLLDLMRCTSNRRACLVSCIGLYVGTKDIFYGLGITQGEISLEEKESPQAYSDLPASNPYYFHSIFVPQGASKTLAEMGGEEFCLYDYRHKSVNDLMSKYSFKSRYPIQLKLPLDIYKEK
jgi:inosine/xanthosine triphosphate pyrophosphatase family protein